MNQADLPRLQVGEDSTTLPAPKKSSKPRKKSNLLNIMLLSNSFEVRGSSAQTLILAEHLGDYGIKPCILTPNISSVAPERRQKLDVREFPYLCTPVVRYVSYKMVEQEFSKTPPDLIHIQSRKMLPTGIRLARRFRCPYIVTIHDYLPKGELLQYNTRYGRRIVAVSEAVKAELLTQPNITGEMVSIIHSGVESIPDDRIRPVLAENCTPVIGTAGPLEQVKGVAFFLNAAKRVLQEFPNVEFLVAGSGPEERNLRQMARTLKIQKHVTFVSNMYGFRESLRAMDIFCLPSLQQGLGTIMLEAMAWGRPVIASKVGGIFSAIENDANGILIPPSDSELMASKLLMLLNNPERAREIGEAARKHVKKNFRIDQTVSQVADLYRKICAEYRNNSNA